MWFCVIERRPVPDDHWGERVHAVIVLREGQQLDEARVIAHCKSLIAGYKDPYWAGREHRVN